MIMSAFIEIILGVLFIAYLLLSIVRPEKF
ncbi:MAG: potassium-transporting ATPase subunit F [Candidatus Aminicenantales bacterium]